MQPGQMHFWNLSDDIDGFVFFHNKNFFDQDFTTLTINEFPFFQSLRNSSVIHCTKGRTNEFENSFKELVQESTGNLIFSSEKIKALLRVIYIELSRDYGESSDFARPSYYLQRIKEFEELINRHFKILKSAGEYAARMNISEKHLNRMTKDTVNKTSTELIAERTILEAKRLLMRESLTVNEICYELGYSDPSYFIRFFKKHTGHTPQNFRIQYSNRL
jgi:AraC family transcriptional regulator, transcriptional activator of pobA